MDQSQAARAEQLKKWRMSRVHEQTLPSGLEVTLRDADIQSIIIEGDIPNTLVDLITSEEFQGLNQEDAGAKMLSEHKNDFTSLLRSLIKASLVSPALADAADETHITYDELTFEDKMFIFNFLNREAQAVRPFRKQPE